MSRLVAARRRTALLAALLLGLLSAAALFEFGSPTRAQAATDPFFSYDGATPLSSVAPGTVLKTRKIPVHILGVPLPITAVQLVYRSTSQLGTPTTNVTSILLPPWHLGSPKLVAYESFYDSLNPEDSPSRAIAGGAISIGGAISQLESGLVSPLLLAGYTVAIADTEGQSADFADGPEYGMNTLDGVRAAENSSLTGVNATTPIGMIGYSGGAIGGEWASELAPTYAPGIAKQLVGTAIGGVLVDPAHNLHYVEGSLIWAGVMPMAIIGAARSFHIDMTPYLSAKGMRAYQKMQSAPISEVLGEYPFLTWKDLAKPQYPTAESVPAYVDAVNHLIMGTGGTPTSPMFIGQASNGILEGTPNDKPGIGAGDGVMIAGDVRTLAREYCSRGATIQYRQYDGLSHTTAAVPFIADSVAWLLGRFNGEKAPQNCSSIAPGNPLLPITPAAGS